MAILATGCASGPESRRDYGDLEQPVELAEISFYPQERYQCGPAALATLLESSGIRTSPEALTPQVYLPERKGSLQVELLAATRAAGRIPYPIDGTMAAVTAELLTGRPVLVLQNLGTGWYPRWHYAVIVGVNPDTDDVILRSGLTRRHVTAVDTFVRTWERGEYWGFVALSPGELPALVDQGRYFRAVADVEATGHYQAAMAGWQAALGIWPESQTAALGVANAAHALGDYPAAESSYRSLLASDPTNLSARNNLAFALAGQGRGDEALAEIRAVLELVAEDDRLRPEFEASYRELVAATE